MIENTGPQVIFYLGPQRAVTTRQALRTMMPSPRSLIVTLAEDPYAFRSCHLHDFDCSCDTSTHPLYTARHVRVAGQKTWYREIFGEQKYDRVFFLDLPDMFCHESTALDLAQSLARLAVMRSADVMTQLPFHRIETIQQWESSLKFSWKGHDHTIGFWLNTQSAPIRYLRMSAQKLIRLCS